MLPRLSAVPRSLRAFSLSPIGRRQPVSPALAHWLSAPGSLTARLRKHGKVTVEVLEQGHQRLWRQERRALGCAQGHVREVLLRIDGRPAVWARSSTTLRAVKGPWRAVKGLGTRPLAELLFEQNGVQRGPLCAEPWPMQAPQRRRVIRQWQKAEGPPHEAAPMWTRRSLFRHAAQPLQVLEAFSPWVAALDAGLHGHCQRT